MRQLALLLTVLTGFSGLVYEVTWEKLLATLLGSHSEATASVLGLFLGGLAVGYSLFGRFTRRRLARAAATGRPPRLVLAYGLLEASIGVYALLTPLLFRAVQALSFAITPAGGATAFALDVFLAALLIAPPAVLMGGTIPILTQALALGLDDATRTHARIYAFNTGGAFVGALAAGFWILPTLGLVGTLLAMGCVNLAAGAVFVLLGVRSRDTQTIPGATQAALAGGSSPVPGFAAHAAAALLIGFAMMTVQTVLIRLGALSFGSSQFTFSMVVAVFVLCIALGSLAVSAIPRVPKWLLVADVWALAGLLVLLYPLLPDTPYWAHRLRVLFPSDPSAFLPYYFAACGGIFALIGLPIALSGASLPLIFDHLRDQSADLGKTAGSLYSANTIGSLLGALLGGYALLFWLDLHQVFRLALVMLAIAASLISSQVLPGERRRLTPVLLAATLGIVFLLPAWPTEKLSSGLFRWRSERPDTSRGFDAFLSRRASTFRPVFYQDGPMLSVAVLDVIPRNEQTESSHTLWSNGKPEGSVLGDFATTAMLGLVPAVLAERAESAFVVGYGTGATVGSLASLDSMREITVAEVSPAVIAAAPHFEDQNGAPLAFPGLEILKQDAYRALMRSDRLYDVIVSEPSNPWMLGVEMLYTPEFLRAAKARLAPGGVHCQWFHVYEADEATIRMVLRSYTSVFEHVAVWYGRGPDILLLGASKPELLFDLERIAERVERPDFAAALARAKVRTLPEFLAHELLPLGVVHAMPLVGEAHSLLHPRLNDVAARAFFEGQTGRLPAISSGEERRVGTRNSLLRRHIERQGGRLLPGEHRRIVDEVCIHLPRQCVTLLAQWKHEVPHSASHRRVEYLLRTKPSLGYVPIQDLEAVQALYDLPAEDGTLVSAMEVEAAATRYRQFYHHAVPFPPEAIDRLLARCGGDDAERARCEDLRRRLLEQGPQPFDVSRASN